MQTTLSFVRSLLVFLMGGINKVFEFINDPGFCATVEASSKLHKMTSFEQWVNRGKHKSKSGL